MPTTGFMSHGSQWQWAEPRGPMGAQGQAVLAESPAARSQVLPCQVLNCPQSSVPTVLGSGQAGAEVRGGQGGVTV